jgi:succinate dehydrogenase/fumarate reductase iron-sulfur protein
MAITLRVQRGTDRDNVTFDSYEVPYREGMSVLDALKQAGHEVHDLAYRWECGQGICGVCTMMINGRAALSCTTLCKTDESYTLEPLVGHPVDKDLLVDFVPRYDKFNSIVPFLQEGGEPIESKAEADASKLLRSCVECWACVAVCPVSLNTDNADALSMVKLARFATDPRDGADRVQMAQEAGLQIYSKTCPSCRACADICPRNIDVYEDAVLVLTDLATKGV